MASAKKGTVAKDFQEIISGDRQRRKNELLAKQIFGKGRRASAPGSGIASRKPGAGLSLADRIGNPKQRAASTTLNPKAFKAGAGKQGPKRNNIPTGNMDAEWTHDLHSLNNSAATPRQGQRQARGGRASLQTNIRRLTAPDGAALSNALSHQVNIVKNAKSSSGMVIRGLAGPYTVIAENFAPGTTAADIESAMAPIGGNILKCVMTASRPVTAEITFENKEGADNVIAQFHNQTADGLLLSLYHKIAASVPAKAPQAVVPVGPRSNNARSDTRTPNTRFNESDRYIPGRDRGRYEKRDETVNDEMDVDDGSGARGGSGLYSDDLVNGREDRNDRARPRGGDHQNRGRGGFDRGRSYR